MAEKNSNTAPGFQEVALIVAAKNNIEASPKRPRAARIKAVPPTPKDMMTADEVRLLAAYRGASDFWQRVYLRALEVNAEDHQLTRRAVPRLRLV